MNGSRLGILMLGICLTTRISFAAVSNGELEQAISVVRNASPTAATTGDIRAGWKTLASADADQIPRMLRGMTDGNPAIDNWILTAVDEVAQRTLDSGEELPQGALVQLLADSSASPRARRVAYEWIEQIDPKSAQVLLVELIDDPSLELRYDAVAAVMEDAKRVTGEDQKQLYRKLLNSARDLDQIKACKVALEELGESIDLSQHMGFVTAWRVIGEFDNTDESGFDTEYPPERELDFKGIYPGKSGQVAWRDEAIATDDELGNVDLNKVIGAKKGVVLYACAEVEVPHAQTATVRYASPNATKLWLNGQLAAANEVYHAGGAVDQYVTPVELEAGTNTILLKVCQNEQTEPWAQDWSFQLRLADELGGAIEMTAVK